MGRQCRVRGAIRRWDNRRYSAAVSTTRPHSGTRACLLSTQAVGRSGRRSSVALSDKTEEHIMMPGRVIPVREMLGELLLELDQPAMALAAFEQSLQNDPNRFRNTYGAARAAERAGDLPKARAYYARLLAQASPDAARSEIDQARTFVAKH